MSISRDELLEPVDVEARDVLKHAFAGSTSRFGPINAHHVGWSWVDTGASRHTGLG